MITFPMIPGVEMNLFLMVLLSLATGIISGFVGVGGGFVMMPALIILGFPAQFAVGTSLIWVMGNSIVGALRHRQLGNVDFKLGLVIMVFTVGGVEIGVRVLNWVKELGYNDTPVLIISICILLIVGGYTFWESSYIKTKLDSIVRRSKSSLDAVKPASISSVVQQIKIPPMIYFPKSQVTISLWVLVVIGLITGILSGLIGCGGGFIMVPSLIYIVGVPSFIAVGTGIFQFVFTAAFGSIRHTISGNVIIYAAFIMILGSSIGVQFGALATKYLRDVSMRYILAYTMFIAVLGSLLQLLSIYSGSTTGWLHYVVITVTFGGLALVMSMVIGLFIAALRYRKGKKIPVWMESLVVY